MNTGGQPAEGAVPPPDVLSGSLRRLTLRGTAWTAVGEFAAQALRLGGNVVLVWLLASQMWIFGLMLIVNTVRRLLAMFSDVGLRPCIVRSPRSNDPAFLNTAWTIQILRGGLIWLTTCALAWPIAWSYDEPILMWLLPVVGLGALMEGFISTGIPVLNRRMQQGWLTILDVAAQLITVVAMISLALVWRSVWALVIGGLIGMAGRVLLSHLLLPEFRMRLAWDRLAVRELMSFGAWIFLATILTGLSNYGDRFILGKLLDPQLFGVLAIVYGIAEVPKRLVNKVNGQVIMPAISNRNHLPPAELRTKILPHRGRMLLWLALAGALLVTVGDQVILVLYPAVVEAGAWMLPLLLVGIWPRIMGNTSNSVLLALGKPQWNTLGSFLKLAFIAVGLPVGYHLTTAYGISGAVGAIAAIALADIPYWWVVSIGAWRSKVGAFGQDLRASLCFGGVLAGGLLLRAAMGFGSPWQSMLP